jgi:(p)ppGpp synthase/HD superfamily hydrolase
MITLNNSHFTIINKNGQARRAPADRQFYLNYLFQSPFHPRIAVLADRIETLAREQGGRAGFDRQRFYAAAGLCLYAHRDVKRRIGGQPYADHPITVAEHEVNILRVADSEELIACLLHDTVEDTEIDLRFIERHFGRAVAGLVDGVTKITQIGKDRNISEENINKFVNTLAKDIRALRIKMVDRGANLEDAEQLSPERRERNCREALDFYVPLGVLCGLMRAARHLSDIAFSKLYPDRYAEISAVIKKTVETNQPILVALKERIEKGARKCCDGRSVEVASKPRTVYEIDQLAAVRGTEARNLSDVVMMQVTAEQEEDCYALVRLVHSLGTPIDRYWHDYLKDPKINHYQSLHTAILVEGTLIRFQIRTSRMQKISQDGLLHDAYSPAGKFRQPKLRWLNADWLKIILQANDRREKILLTKSLAQAWLATIVVKGPSLNTVYRDVLLPRGVTPLEIAFIADPQLGVCLVGASQEDLDRPLDTRLKDGVGFIKLAIGGQAQERDFAGLLQNPLARLRFKAHLSQTTAAIREGFARRILGEELAHSFLNIRELEANDPDKVGWLVGKTAVGELSAEQAAEELRREVRSGGEKIKALGRLEMEMPERSREQVIDTLRQHFSIERYGFARSRLQLSLPLHSDAQAKQFNNFVASLRDRADTQIIANSEVRPPLIDDLALNPHSLFYSYDLAWQAARALQEQQGEVIDLNLDPPLIYMLPPEHRVEVDRMIANYIESAKILFFSAHSPEQLDNLRTALAELIRRSMFALPLMVAYVKEGMYQTEGIIRHLAELTHVSTSLTDMGHDTGFILDCLYRRAGELTAR